MRVSFAGFSFSENKRTERKRAGRAAEQRKNQKLVMEREDKNSWKRRERKGDEYGSVGRKGMRLVILDQEERPSDWMKGF